MTNKFDPERAKEAVAFIEKITGDSFPGEFQESLKSGVILCNFLNKLEPGSIAKFQTSNLPFKQMENIESYISASRRIGVPEKDNFVTIDLYEGKNLGQVVLNILSLKRLKGFGFDKQSISDAPKPLKDFTSQENTTDQKSTRDYVQKDPAAVKLDVQRIGPAFVTGRLDNTKAEICFACSLPVTTGQVNAMNKIWHVNCFTCKKCGIKLSTAKYYEHDSKSYCERCILIVNPHNAVKVKTRE